MNRISFIDYRINAYQTLIAGLPEHTEYYLLDTDRDGIQHIAEYLSGRRGVDAIDLFSHGSSAALYLGSTVLTRANLGRYQSQLTAIGASLSESSDILLYGCNIAEGEAGQALMQELANATGADLAGSINTTGSGGDWVLEYRSGEVESQSITVSAYQSTLAIYEGTADSEVINGSAENDYISGGAGNDILNGNGGNDTLVGGAGNDKLICGNGDDKLDGGAGTNELYGGYGNDLYIIRSRSTFISDSGGDADSALVFAIGVAEPQSIWSGDYPIENWQMAPGVVAELPYWVKALIYSNSEQFILDRVGSGANTLYYYFPDSKPADISAGDANGWSALTSQERNSVRQMLNYLEGIVDLHFVEASNAAANGTLTFAFNQTTDDPKLAGYAYSPDFYGNSSIFYDVDYRSLIFSKGSLVLHEIGHALGLDHPFEGDSLSSVEDQRSWTIMSYKGVGPNFTLSPLDIAALQSLYGPSLKSRVGDDTYVLKATTTNLIWDGGGTDVIDGSALQSNMDISLMEGYWGFIGAKRPALVTSAGSVTINVGTVVENAKGGKGNDKILGNYSDNILEGNAGNDTLDGLGGDDVLIGGSGFDIAVLHGTLDDFEIVYTGNGSYTVVDTRISNSGYGDTYAISEMERLQFDDVIIFLSTDGNDVIIGTDSADTIDGQVGDDTISGLASNDNLGGGPGNDLLDGGIGADTLKGGLGNDTYIVDNIGDVVTENSDEGTDLVNVNIATANGTYTLGDHLENARLINTVAYNLTGNALDNVLTGNAAANTLTGAEGDDTLDGGAGGDVLIGGEGNDQLFGGSGADYFVLNSPFSETSYADTIMDFNPKDDTIRLDSVFLAEAGLAKGGLIFGAFHSGAVDVATEADDRIIYNINSGHLFFDADGSGIESGAVMIGLVGVNEYPTLTHLDFVVI